MPFPEYAITHDCTTQHRTPQHRSRGVSSSFPACRGVVEFRGQDGSTLLLAATGDLRSFIAQRLNESGGTSTHADLAPVTARVLAQPTGSALESDLLVLERARTADPDLYARLTHQNRRALLILNPETGTWRTAETTSPEIARDERVIGPCLSTKAAQLLGEALDDVHELCRNPAQLARAPRGTPCMYKDMGRCPAACDGSEPMHAYHARFARGVEDASGGIDAWGDSVRDEIRRASSALDFEGAARAKRQLDTIDALPRDALIRAGSLHAFSCIIVTPALSPGNALCWVFNAGGCEPVCSITLLDNDLLESLPGLLGERRSPIGFGRPQLDRFSLIARHWLTKPTRQRRRRVTIIDTRTDGWATRLRPAIEAAQHASDPGHDDEEHTLLPV